jgi:hypothetical protein
MLMVTPLSTKVKKSVRLLDCLCYPRWFPCLRADAQQNLFTRRRYNIVYYRIEIVEVKGALHGLNTRPIPANRHPVTSGLFKTLSLRLPPDCPSEKTPRGACAVAWKSGSVTATISKGLSVFW